MKTETANFDAHCPECPNGATGATRLTLPVTSQGAPTCWPTCACGATFQLYPAAADAAQDQPRELLRECLRALNCARRFNYGRQFAGWRTRYAKPDSYQLAARLEAYLGEPVTRPALLPPSGIAEAMDDARGARRKVRE